MLHKFQKEKTLQERTLENLRLYSVGVVWGKMPKDRLDFSVVSSFLGREVPQELMDDFGNPINVRNYHYSVTQLISNKLKERDRGEYRGEIFSKKHGICNPPSQSFWCVPHYLDFML